MRFERKNCRSCTVSFTDNDINYFQLLYNTLKRIYVYIISKLQKEIFFKHKPSKMT